MLKLFAFLFITFGVSLIIYICLKKLQLNSKTNIYVYAIKDYSVIDFNLLYSIMLRYFKKDFKLVVIQDDIKFRSSNFYWPKNSIYIHMSDAINIVNNQFILNILSEYSEPNIEFLKTKIYIT